MILNDQMSIMSNRPFKQITPDIEPVIWYTLYEIIHEDAPECLDQFIEETASKMELPVDYLIQEFL